MEFYTAAVRFLIKNKVMKIKAILTSSQGKDYSPLAFFSQLLKSSTCRSIQVSSGSEVPTVTIDCANDQELISVLYALYDVPMVKVEIYVHVTEDYGRFVSLDRLHKDYQYYTVQPDEPVIGSRFLRFVCSCSKSLVV